MHYHANPDQFTALVETLYPGRWDLLNEILRNTPRGPRAHEKQEIAETLRRRIQRLSRK